MTVLGLSLQNGSKNDGQQVFRLQRRKLKTVNAPEDDADEMDAEPKGAPMRSPSSDEPQSTFARTGVPNQTWAMKPRGR